MWGLRFRNRFFCGILHASWQFCSMLFNSWCGSQFSAEIFAHCFTLDYSWNSTGVLFRKSHFCLWVNWIVCCNLDEIELCSVFVILSVKIISCMRTENCKRHRRSILLEMLKLHGKGHIPQLYSWFCVPWRTVGLVDRHCSLAYLEMRLITQSLVILSPPRCVCNEWFAVYLMLRLVSLTFFVWYCHNRGQCVDFIHASIFLAYPASFYLLGYCIFVKFQLIMSNLHCMNFCREHVQ